LKCKEWPGLSLIYSVDRKYTWENKIAQLLFIMKLTFSVYANLTEIGESVTE